MADARPQRRQEVAQDGAVSLTTGKLNAVRAASTASSRPQSQGNLEFRYPMPRKALAQGKRREA